MENELISIIVPIYNMSKYLDRCMESLLKQTYTNIEIIMVDDGSPDDCGSKCDDYASRDRRIKVIHKQNAGLGMARNSGLDIANGKYVAFIDSDDYVDIEMIEKLYHRLQNTKADTCFCRYYNVTAEKMNILAPEIYKKNNYQQDEIKEILLGMIGSLPEEPGDVEIGMSVWKGLYSLDIINKSKIRFQSERKYISEDIIFHIEYLQKAQKVVVEETPNYYYCDNGGSLTKSYKANRFEMEKILFQKVINELDKIFQEEEYNQRLFKSFLGRVRRCISQEVNDNSNRKNVRKNIKQICEDQLVQSVIEKFDDKNLQVTKRMVNFFMKYKMVLALYCVFKIRK